MIFKPILHAYLQSAFEITFYKLVKKITAMRQTKLTALGSLLACCLFAFSFSQAQESSPALRIKGYVKGTMGQPCRELPSPYSSHKQLPLSPMPPATSP